ncbi:uncharacterized protein LOC105629378 [Jatropha curcas]|uniref:uncharacterized protein LOC105629378 n=1 Tax=Jatropha curcas TaxID=180498 RepID=UPI0018960763|nr:uncharacterized protein LOC105629378 [Jatropha curcas]XP_037496693.1 uncharacterized protein LOC105629378 [Jatropha curcas]XP_037496694.1 uncharacterized protein LOC105629378 [Jatropha curcas]XP_037496695.1 uncharacterized protein LOC105629378 [Jatropha curcas]XP_037496696.1 uncharacterized protein LOC105629378 [Jatropha curcas]XP_037496697.1 uncharacterized protein LOC105629378 [Jatropha curcas]
MGVSGKWIKALVGLKKSEKAQSSEKGDNSSQRTTTSKFRHRRKHSVEIDADKLQEFSDNVAEPIGEANIHSVPDVSESPSASLQAQNVADNQQILREEWAATRIQTAFRGFLKKGWMFYLVGFIGNDTAIS